MPAWFRVCLIAAGAFVYGLSTAHLPAPRTDPTTFWLGNLAAPYLLIAFLAGAWGFRPVAASAAGALAAASAVAGFYNILMVGDVTNSEMDLPPTVTARSAMLHAYGAWFRNLLLGEPGGLPWLTIGLAVGLVFGHLGYRWARDRTRFAGAAVALAFVVEPLAHITGLGASITGARQAFHGFNLLVWGVEGLAGVLGLVWVWRASGRTAPDRADDSSGVDLAAGGMHPDP